ncbi:hypothetical protein GCM10020220_043570 [Nonomuraea rubra]|uniref:PH domain-containing protein n=1 Tax=Nonomuraea rubra TaxID=46180 RepID=UPI0031EB2042
MAVFIAEPFKLPDRVAIVAVRCGVAWLLHLLGGVRWTADDQGLTIVNAARTHRVTWPEVLEVTMVVGDPLAAPRPVRRAYGRGHGHSRARRRPAPGSATAELRALIRQRGEAQEG